MGGSCTSHVGEGQRGFRLELGRGVSSQSVSISGKVLPVQVHVMLRTDGRKGRINRDEAVAPETQRLQATLIMRTALVETELCCVNVVRFLSRDQQRIANKRCDSNTPSSTSNGISQQ